MARNEILDEIYAAREELLKRYNGDIHAYVVDARKRALASGKVLVTADQRGHDDEAEEPMK